MSLDLYKQAVRLIKVAEDNRPSTQSQFYSDPANSGLIVYPRGVIDRTKDFDPGNDYAKIVSSYLQNEYSNGDDGIRSGNVSGEWKESANKHPQSYNPLQTPDAKTVANFADLGLDFNDPKIQRLGNDPSVYTFRWRDSTNYRSDKDAINYNKIQLHPATTDDAYRVLAHETAHRQSMPNMNVWTTTSNAIKNRSWGDWFRNTFNIRPWEGAYVHEWPSVVNEWTAGQPGGTIHPTMVRVGGKAKPLRKFNNKDWDTDPYLNDMFPLVDPKDLKSEPGKEYRYWHAPGEPDKPAEGKKRIAYDTPTGWWVNSFGDWEQTGGTVFDADYFLKNNMNLAEMPYNIQKDVHNMSVLNNGQPSEEEQLEAQIERDKAQDMLARLALDRQFRYSGGKTYGQLIADTANAIANVRDNVELKLEEPYVNSDPSPEVQKIVKQINELRDMTNKLKIQNYPYDQNDAVGAFWDKATKKNQLGKKYVTIKGKMPYNMNAWIEYNPMWDPNMTLQPIPIGLAGLQKKYSITPTLDEPSDWRTPAQYRAIQRDAQHSYDLQNELDTYGPKDGGMGS